MYDPLSIATAVGSIVSLLSQFTSEGENRDAKSLGEYLDWLRRHEHKELVERIESSTELSDLISDLLHKQQHELLANFKQLEDIFAGIAGRFKEFRPLVAAVNPGAMISEQCISILRQMNAAGASYFWEGSWQHGMLYNMQDGKHGQIVISDQRFIDDDLITMCEMGLLRLNILDHGVREFRITRAGAKLGE